MASFVADAIRDTTFGQQIGGFLTNEPSSDQSITTEFTYIVRTLINLTNATNSFTGEINFNMYDDLTGRVPMANLFQTYQVMSWEGFITTYWPDAYVTAGAEILLLATPYSRSPYTSDGSAGVTITGFNLANLPGTTSKILIGPALQNGMEQGNAVKILNTEPMYSMVTRSAGNVSSADNGQTPASRPLQLQYWNGGDRTTWQVGFYQLEGLSSNFVTSVVEVTFYAKVKIKFEGIRWGTVTWPHAVPMQEYLLCDHCGHQAMLKGRNYRQDTVSVMSGRSHRGGSRGICCRQEEPLSLLSEVQQTQKDKHRDLYAESSERCDMGCTYNDKTKCRNPFHCRSIEKIQELHTQKRQGSIKAQTDTEDAPRDKDRESDTTDKKRSDLHRDTRLLSYINIVWL